MENASTAVTGKKPTLAKPDRFRDMNCVTVVAVALDQSQDQSWDVYWRIGKHRQGICRTTVAAELALSEHDARIAAELSAMQWLLEVRHAAGKRPNLKRTELIFSCGAPAKLSVGSSGKACLYPYAYFLTTRFAGATITTEANSEWILPRAQKWVSHHWIDGPTGECLTVPGIGPMWLTNHLMRQFRLRLNNQPQAQAWKVLEKLLTRCTLRKLPQSPRAAGQLLALHRPPAIRLYDPVSHWVFVLAELSGRPTLMTAYIRS